MSLHERLKRVIIDNLLKKLMKFKKIEEIYIFRIKQVIRQTKNLNSKNGELRHEFAFSSFFCF